MDPVAPRTKASNVTEREKWEIDALGWFRRIGSVPEELIKALQGQIKAGWPEPPLGSIEDLVAWLQPIPDAFFDDWVLNIAMMRTLPGDATEGTMANFHGGSGATGLPFWTHDVDAKSNPRVGVLSIIVELDEAPGTRLISGSHRSRLPVPKVSCPITSFRNVATSYYATRGDILVWNEHIAHWGPPGPGKDRVRRTIVLKFTHPRTTLRGEPWPRHIGAGLDRKHRRWVRDAYGRTPREGK